MAGSVGFEPTINGDITRLLPFFVSLWHLIRNEFPQRLGCYGDLEPYFSQLTISATLFPFLYLGISSDTPRGVNEIT